MVENIYEEVFVKEKVVFLGVDDLYLKLDQIRQGYLNMSKNFQQIYKWYFFYQLCLLHKADYLKSAFWEFLNCSDEMYEIKREIVNNEYEYFDFRRKNLFKSKN